MNASVRSPTATESMFASYAQLTQSLVPHVAGICLLDEKLRSQGEIGPMRADELAKWLRALGWTSKAAARRNPASRRESSDHVLTALPLETSDYGLLGVLCVRQSGAGAAATHARHASLIAQQLRPVLDCLNREIAARQPERSRIQTLTERTAELEWLFKVTSGLGGATDERRVIEELLSAATERLKSGLGVLFVPERRLSLEHERDAAYASTLRASWHQTRPHLLTWAQRQRRPLVMNGAGRSGEPVARCKILSVPIVRESGRVIGILAFFNPPEAPDYRNRHTFLARHLGRQTAGVVEAQFDLMTGLYTREGLEQIYARIPETPERTDRSVIYIDIDHMHLVNELHGFELGNELIVRVADLLCPPQLPEGALAARLSGDRFAVVLPGTDARGAVPIAEQLQAAVKRLVIGPVQDPIEISVTCGAAALVCMPQGLGRALAAAELACKTAKGRGRNRVELYACEDASMMRRHDDVLAVGELRSAFKADRLLLYAQRIVPLQNSRLPGGYEILMRVRGPDGSAVAPGPVIHAAQRYQLLPSIDRWVTQRALSMLAPYRAMLKSRGLSISVNLTGQSIGSDEFTRQLCEDVRTANLPADSLTFEITEQAAVASLARASEMIRALQPWGCRFALDDFGTGSNSLAYLKALPIARLKIDGSFVHDILTSPRSQATVRGIVELARGFSMETVAEFVENDSIADRVRRLGVDYAQGYAFGKPEPLDSVLEGLAREESRRQHRLFLEM